MNTLLQLSGVAQARLVRDGQISSSELVETHLARIAEINGGLNAVVELLADSARAASRAADERRSRRAMLGPLDGVPFSIKDSIELAGSRCSAGTLGLRQAPRSTRDATLVGRLRGAGAVPIARTNLPDLLFAFESDNLIYGRTNNPYDQTRTSGGSSGGEAALIAACGSPMGLGSDAAGSVRLPAHFCGIASLKPTSGRLARTGHVPPSGGWLETVWQIGPMARRVEDLCAMMAILSGPDGEDHTVVPMPLGDPLEIDVDGLRIAWFDDNGIAPPTRETAALVRRAAEALGAREHRPPCIEESYDLEMKLIGPDGGDGLRDYLAATGSHRTHPLLDGWLAKLEPYRTNLAGFGQYWDSLYRFRAAMHRYLQSYDAVLSPACATPAVPHGTSIEDATFRGFSYTMTYNVTGWPAAVVRCGESPEGLPINLQIAAHPWREDVALAVALRLEQLFGGWQAPVAVDTEVPVQGY
ncbi:MAG TPA: amidase [Candidatus Sulfopaludibacter sp.]|jgi:amidase|nr:amidase [Candidatus Sulfopaludibacter sp.]